MTRSEMIVQSMTSHNGEEWGLYRTQHDGSIRAAPMAQPYAGRQVYLGPDGGVRTGPGCPPDVVSWYLDLLREGV